MKKLIMPLILAATLTSTTASASEGGTLEDFANSFENAASTSVAGQFAVTATIGIFYPVPALLSVSSYFVLAGMPDPSYYEGLAEDSIEVLAGNSSVEDSLSLSMFKEDLLNHQEAVEAKFQEEGFNMNLEQISDEELAELALATSMVEK
tara:strand:+ start:7711 stop:8160 length:450 start_codon:yes stop_codon:yes gene_type:complete